MNSISNIQLPPGVTNLTLPAGSGGDVQAGGSSPFKDMLLDAIHEVNAMQGEADKAVQAWATGEDVNPAEVLTAVQKADLTFRMMMQVRNKLVAALDEIRNIRI